MSPRLDTDTAREPTPGDEFGTENKVRLVTATSLFDGHDAAINIMRRIAQAHGAEVIHLGHNRSALEIVDATCSTCWKNAGAVTSRSSAAAAA